MRQHSGQAFPLQLGPGPRFPLPGELQSASSLQPGPLPCNLGKPRSALSPLAFRKPQHFLPSGSQS